MRGACRNSHAWSSSSRGPKFDRSLGELVDGNKPDDNNNNNNNIAADDSN